MAVDHDDYSLFPNRFRIASISLFFALIFASTVAGRYAGSVVRMPYLETLSIFGQPLLHWSTALLFRPSQWNFLARWVIASVLGVLGMLVLTGFDAMG